MLVEWKIIFAKYQVINPRDMISFTDPQGVKHAVFVEAERDNAGRNSAYSVRAIEHV